MALSNFMEPGSASAMHAPSGSTIATRTGFAGSVSTLASAASYVIAATWLVGVQVCLHGRDFLMGIVSGEPLALTSASIAIIAGALTTLSLRHHRATALLMAELETIKDRLSIEAGASPSSLPQLRNGASADPKISVLWDQANHISITRA